MKKVIIPMVCSVLMSSYGAAADFDKCAVDELIQNGDRNGTAKLSCEIVPIPACATASKYIGFDTSTTQGKHFFAMLMTAQATGAKVSGAVHDTACSPNQSNTALVWVMWITR